MKEEFVKRRGGGLKVLPGHDHVHCIWWCVHWLKPVLCPTSYCHIQTIMQVLATWVWYDLEFRSAMDWFLCLQNSPVSPMGVICGLSPHGWSTWGEGLIAGWGSSALTAGCDKSITLCSCINLKLNLWEVDNIAEHHGTCLILFQLVVPKPTNWQCLPLGCADHGAAPHSHPHQTMKMFKFTC